MVSYFYHFSIIFYEIPKSGKIEKKMNSDGLKLAQVSPCIGESALASARGVSFAQRTLVI